MFKEEFKTDLSESAEKEIDKLMKQLDKVKKEIKPSSKNEFSMQDWADFLQLQGKLEVLFNKVDMS